MVVTNWGLDFEVVLDNLFGNIILSFLVFSLFKCFGSWNYQTRSNLSLANTLVITYPLEYTTSSCDIHSTSFLYWKNSSCAACNDVMLLYCRLYSLIVHTTGHDPGAQSPRTHEKMMDETSSTHSTLSSGSRHRVDDLNNLHTLIDAAQINPEAEQRLKKRKKWELKLIQKYEK